MITRNLIMASLNNISSGTPAYKDMNGNFEAGYQDYYVNGLKKFVAVKKSSLASQKSTFIIGSGDTAESVYDYTLANEIDDTDFTIDNASVTNPTGANETNWHDFKRTYTQTWTYNGTSEVTIKEIGLVNMFDWNGQHFCLNARQVLDSPITVNQGDTFTVSMTIG